MICKRPGNLTDKHLQRIEVLIIPLCKQLVFQKRSCDNNSVLASHLLKILLL